MAGFDARSWANLSDKDLLALSDAEFDTVTGDIASLLLEGPIQFEPEQPPASLWAAIAAALENDDAVEDGAVVDSPIGADRPLALVRPLEGHRSVAAPEPAFEATSRWSGFTAVLTLIAACILLVLIPIGLSMRSDGNEVDVIATTDLDVLDPAATEGHADLVLEEDHELIALDLSATAPGDDHLELWLLAFDDDGGVADMVSLGNVDGSGSYAIPDGVDTGRFNTVDVSIEADDGDATHSGHSVLRGQLMS